MKTANIRWTTSSGWEKVDAGTAEATSLVLVFSDHAYFRNPACYTELRGLFPHARILGCSSAGNVLGTVISDNDMVATMVSLQRGRVDLVVEDLGPGMDVAALAAEMMHKLAQADLRHVFVLSDGLQVNGSELAKGFQRVGEGRIGVTGGLAGDGARFGETWVMADAPARRGRIAALGFFGEITATSGCASGWEEFGAERLVTRSVGNVVYTIDDQPALALYKKYLGVQASELPASGLRFPLNVRASKHTTPIIRTLLAVDEMAQSLTFAGDVPEGNYCKFMKTNFDRLIDNAAMAAEQSETGKQGLARLCLVVSCVGRRLVLGQLTEEELDAVRGKLGRQTAITGFYSYGELAPFGEALQCQLHNQTMTLTVIAE